MVAKTMATESNKIENKIDEMIENNKKKIENAIEKGDLEREYFHEGSVSALEAVKTELQK